MKKELFSEVIIPVTCGGEVHQIGVSTEGPLRVLNHPGTTTSGLLRMWELMGKPAECGCAQLVAMHKQNTAGRTNLWTWNKMHFPGSYTGLKQVPLEEQRERVLTQHLQMVYRFQEGKYDTRRTAQATYTEEPKQSYAERAEGLRQSRCIARIEEWLKVTGRSQYDYDIHWVDTQDTPVRSRFSRRRSDNYPRIHLAVNSKRWRDLLFQRDDTGTIFITACDEDRSHFTLTRYKEMKWTVEGIGFDASAKSFVRKSGTLTYTIATQALVWAWRS